MTFGPRHYVPVLKVKRAEKTALATISLPLRAYIVPLLEIVERQDKPLDEHLNTSFAGLAANLFGYQRCMLDSNELKQDGPAAADEVFNRARSSGISFTPVTGISRAADIKPAVAFAHTHGIAIRLTDQDFTPSQLATNLPNFLLQHGLHSSGVDLIIDLGDVGDLIPAGIIHKTRHFLGDVPNKGQWRTLTVTGTAFPRGMGVVGRNSSKSVSRAEWLAWRDGLYQQRASLERLPTYSDCAIQHPRGVEGFDARYMQASPTVRYALDHEWLLLKGETSKATSAKEQFPNLATQLVYGHLQGQYRGRDHCEGCKLVQNSANGLPRLGSPEIWRKIGTIHHIATVHDGLEGLQWP